MNAELKIRTVKQDIYWTMLKNMNITSLASHSCTVGL